MPKSIGKPYKRHRPKKEDTKKVKKLQAPGKTIESRENQLIGLAVGLAERQIREGTASSQVITHFLKLGSTQMLLEKAKLDKENKLLEAKTAALESQKKVEELYANAFAAMRVYNGQEVESDEDD
jgi:hypothetical protein